LISYEDRLVLWNKLRTENANNRLGDCLTNVNNWWQMLPIDKHHLHWEDEKNWPDPWDILADGIFCDLAKSLGIIYTLYFMDRPDIYEIKLAETTEGHSLVLVNDGDYILNWAPNEILNISTAKLQIHKTMGCISCNQQNKLRQI
jgi:hypothetical protein